MQCVSCLTAALDLVPVFMADMKTNNCSETRGCIKNSFHVNEQAQGLVSLGTDMEI